MGITIRNDHVADPASPILKITSGTGKTKSETLVKPQESISLGEGEITLSLEEPAKPASEDKGEDK